MRILSLAGRRLAASIPTLILILIGVFLSWFFNRTRVGLRMTAVAEDHQVAMSLGISVQRSIAFAWLLGAMLSTMGAMVHLSGRSINMLSSDIGMAALPVALLAGLESLAGLLLAFGLALAGVEAVTSSLLPSLLLLPLFGGVSGLLIGGAIALRPDIGRVAMTVRKETRSGHWVVVAHPVNAAQRHGAERVFHDLHGRTVRSL